MTSGRGLLVWSVLGMALRVWLAIGAALSSSAADMTGRAERDWKGWRAGGLKG
jgi:hypothetical protein